MTELKALTIADKVFNIIKNALILSGTTLVALIAVIANLFSELFTNSYTCKGWQIALAALLILCLIGTAEIVIKRINNKRLFEEGAKVQIKDTVGTYLVQPYNFFKPAECILLSARDNKIYKIDQNSLQKYKPFPYRTVMR